jgi:integrase
MTDPKTGRKVKTKSKKWWGRFRDEQGNEKRVPLATDRAAAQEYLADLRNTGRSIATSNHYQRAIKMFTRWLVRDRRTPEDRLAHVSRMNADADRRRVRRPLLPEEFPWLLEAAETGPTIQCISGVDRAILYIIAAYTGFRRGEIGSVTVRSFDFESEIPTLTVQAGYSKRRSTDVLPLRKDFAQRIQAWLADRPGLSPQDPLFCLGHRRTARMIARDLEAARAKWIGEARTHQERKRREENSFLKYVDDDGRFADFHALRKTFITNLSLAGVQPKAAQTLARHSDINLTMNTYTMLRVLDQAAAVESLPPVPNAVVRSKQHARTSRSSRTEATVPLSTSPLPPDVAQILAAWEQLPTDVRARLAAEIPPDQTRQHA